MELSSREEAALSLGALALLIAGIYFSIPLFGQVFQTFGPKAKMEAEIVDLKEQTKTVSKELADLQTRLAKTSLEEFSVYSAETGAETWHKALALDLAGQAAANQLDLIKLLPVAPDDAKALLSQRAELAVDSSSSSSESSPTESSPTSETTEATPNEAEPPAEAAAASADDEAKASAANPLAALNQGVYELQFRGTYQNMFNFLRVLKNKPKVIEVLSARFTNEAGPDRGKGSTSSPPSESMKAAKPIKLVLTVSIPLLPNNFSL